MIYSEYQAVHAHRALRRLVKLYPNYDPIYLEQRLELFLGREGQQLAEHQAKELWSHSDAVLITYGDMISDSENESTLKSLNQFASEQLKSAFSIIHILPFFPWSSDDGFSVIDFRKVDKKLGTWRDIDRFSPEFDIMADLVLNHASSQSNWFKEFLKDILPSKNFFVTAEPSEELKKVVRPRTHPLLTEVNTRSGVKHVWTTFSADQVDLNFSHPDLLFEMLDILMLYVKHGARIIRLDAIAYLWKEIGTECIHHENTHRVVKLFRDVLDLLAPQVIVLTETNVPHQENISYFGENGGDEANMVYNFSLPPLLLYSILSGNTQYLNDWAKNLSELPAHQTWLNFTASHDGIGCRPLQGLIPQKEFDELILHVKSMRGRVSYKTNSDGSESPYELNITYFAALGTPQDENTSTHIHRFLLSQAFVMAFKGIPAFYFNSLLGAGNFEEGFSQTGMPRTLNRQKWSASQLDYLLKDSERHHSFVFKEIVRLLKIRNKQDVFHPNSMMQVLDLPEKVVGFIRSNDENEVLCLYNFSDEHVHITLTEMGYKDLVDNITYSSAIEMEPYQFMWLKTLTGLE